MPTHGKNGIHKPNKLHLLQVLGNAIVGGMENYVRNLIGQLPADRFKITCVFPYESDITETMRGQGHPVFIVPMEDDPPWRSIQAMVELVRSQRADLIHAHMPRAHVLAGLAGGLTHTPAVATIHGKSITSQELGICRTTGSHLIVICQEAYFQALAMGVPPGRVTLIHNGIDTEVFKPGGSGQEFRQALGIPLDAPLVGWVGRLAPEKGPDMFIQAAQHINCQRDDVHFALVGEGELRDSLADMIRNFDLNDRVHLAGLWTDTSRVYPAFDVLAQTSRTEGMSLALLEAMACGLPVVALAVGGVSDLIVVGNTGIIAGPGDWVGVANGLLELLACPDRRRQMGQAGRQRVKTLFDLRDSARRTGDLFQHLVKTGQSQYLQEWTVWPAFSEAG